MKHQTGFLKDLAGCWDKVSASTALLEQMIEQILRDNPEMITMPPPVTDGSLAAPGALGEVWSATGTGQWSGSGSNTIAPLSNMVITQPALPPGDWDISWQMILPSVTSTTGVSVALVRLSSPLPAGLLNNMQGYSVNIPTNMAPAGDPTPQQPLIVTGPRVPFSNAVQQGLVFNLFIWASGIVTQGPYTMNVWGRRVR